MIKFKKFTISAVIKCNNEDTFLEECIKSIQPFVDEIVLINNNSTDNSVSIAKSLNIKILDFCDWPAGNISLAEYYNWCTLQTSGDYIIKWDADMVAFENYGTIRKYLNDNIDAVFYSLYDMYGDHKHTRKNIICGPEPYLFKRHIQHYNNHDGIERLPFWGENKNKITQINKPMGLHMNIKNTERYVLREIMKEYRKCRRNKSLLDWAKENYDMNLEIEKMEIEILKNIIPYKGDYPKILNKYLNNPTWEIVYEHGIPVKRIKK